MAELFLAKDSRSRELVVIKRILPYLAEEPEFVRMFLDEARIVSQLHHPNVVELKELGKLEGTLFIAMEWVNGTDLRKVCVRQQEKRKRVPWYLGAYAVTKLCAGLHYAHRRAGLDGRVLGIVHRDVSPQNVMIGYRGEVKLVDFGIAKATAWVTRSKPGVIKGKFQYLAPEMLGEGKGIDARADIFSVGAVLYEVTTGQSPFHRATSEGVIAAIRSEVPAEPHELIDTYPLALSEIVMRCLEKDPAHRFQTCEELRLALDDVLAADRPTTREQLTHFMESLFGTESERTAVNEPRPSVPSPRSSSPQPPRISPPAPALTPPPPPASDLRAIAAAIDDVLALGAEPSAPSDPTMLMPAQPSVRPGPPVPSPPARKEHLARIALKRIPVPVPPPAEVTDQAEEIDPDDFAPIPTVPAQAPAPSAPARRRPVAAAPPPVEDTVKDKPIAARRRRHPSMRGRPDTQDQVPTASVAEEMPEDDGDDDSLVSAGESSRRVKTALLVVLGVGCLITASALMWLSFPPKAGPIAETPVVDAPANVPVVRALVQFQAPKGTQISMGSLNINAGEVRQVETGAVSITWRCKKAGGRSKPTTRAFDIKAGPLQVLQLTCE